MTFDSAKEMLDTIFRGIDLYSPSGELYVFGYNDNDEMTAICVYRKVKRDSVNEYLGDNEYFEFLEAYLEWINSTIFCDDFCDDECLEWCEDKYKINDWMHIKKGGTTYVSCGT